jgi:hypothetical protein
MPEKPWHTSGAVLERIDQIIVKGDAAKADVLFDYVMGNGRAG